MQRGSSLTIVLVMMGAGVLSCGKKDSDAPAPATVSGTCTTSVEVADQEATSCLLYAGYAAATLKDVEASCATDLGGTWKAESACPSADLVGTCALPTGGAAAGISVTDHYYPAYSAATAEAECTSSEGVFTAP